MDKELMDEKYKTLLRACMEKKMSLDTIQQVICLSDYPNPIEKADQLLKIVDQSTEMEFREVISKILEQRTR